MKDVICAIATPPGRSAIAALRLSGEGSISLLSAAFVSKRELAPRELTFGRLTDGDTVIDECMAAVFPAPRSYTGEEMAEIYLHGGAMPSRMVLELFLKLGARIAEPGEFSRRAFVNGKLDLTEAEAVIGLIDAQTEAQAKNALRGVGGELKKRVVAGIEELTDILAAIEAAIEYPEEEFPAPALTGRIETLREKITSLAATYAQGRVLTEGLNVAIAGRPNVGKSSLLNALLGTDRAIVTQVAGTTRDVIDGVCDIGGIPVRFFDTAGIRETGDEVERCGVERSMETIEGADLVLYTVDASLGVTIEDAELISGLPEGRALLVLNKTDLPAVITPEAAQESTGLCCIPVCAADGANLPALKEYIRSRAALSDMSGLLITQERHAAALRAAAAALESAAAALNEGLPEDMCGIDIREAREALGSITGQVTSEEIVDRIFKNFCLGK